MAAKTTPRLVELTYEATLKLFWRKQASGRRTALLLFDAMHLYLFLSGTLTFQEVILRVRRHASQTGEAYLPVAKFGG